MTGLRVLPLAAVLVAVLLLPISWSGMARADVPKTLVIAVSADHLGLDPQTTHDNGSAYIMSTIFDGLMSYQLGTSVVAPGLAQTWTVSPDGKVYTFKIRSGVTFHDGSPLNARTVAADLDRAVNPNNPCYVFSRKALDTYDDFTFGTMKDGTAAHIQALDDATLQITLPKPNAPFLTDLAMVWSGIMSPVATQKYNCDASKAPVGTGPFRFVEYVASDHTTLEANPSYWGDHPKVDRLVFQVVPEGATAVLRLERNEVQILTDVPTAFYGRISGNHDLKLYTQPGLTLLGVGMFTGASPFSEKRVRQAMNYAVDKDAINKALYGGATTASQGEPPVLWGYNKSVKPYPYDPAKAQALLREAGFGSGFATEMMVYANPRGYNPAGGAKLGEAIQGYLAKVGVTVKLVQYEWGAYIDKLHHSPWQGFAICGWSGDNGDPDNFLGPLFGFDEVAGKPQYSNCASYHSQAFDQLITRGQQATSQADRERVYLQANAILHDDAPWIFVNHMNQVRAARGSVTGVTLNPLQMFFHMERVGMQ